MPASFAHFAVSRYHHRQARHAGLFSNHAGSRRGQEAPNRVFKHTSRLFQHAAHKPVLERPQKVPKIAPRLFSTPGKVEQSFVKRHRRFAAPSCAYQIPNLLKIKPVVETIKTPVVRRNGGKSGNHVENPIVISDPSDGKRLNKNKSVTSSKASTPGSRVEPIVLYESDVEIIEAPVRIVEKLRTSRRTSNTLSAQGHPSLVEIGTRHRATMGRAARKHMTIYARSSRRSRFWA